MRFQFLKNLLKSVLQPICGVSWWKFKLMYISLLLVDNVVEFFCDIADLIFYLAFLSII